MKITDKAIKANKKQHTYTTKSGTEVVRLSREEANETLAAQKGSFINEKTGQEIKNNRAKKRDEVEKKHSYATEDILRNKYNNKVAGEIHIDKFSMCGLYAPGQYERIFKK